MCSIYFPLPISLYISLDLPVIFSIFSLRASIDSDLSNFKKKFVSSSIWTLIWIIFFLEIYSWTSSSSSSSLDSVYSKVERFSIPEVFIVSSSFNSLPFKVSFYSLMGVFVTFVNIPFRSFTVSSKLISIWNISFSYVYTFTVILLILNSFFFFVFLLFDIIKINIINYN